MAAVIIAHLYLLVPMLGIIYLGIRRERQLKDRQLARALIALHAQQRRRRY